jgi:MFS family permease
MGSSFARLRDGVGLLTFADAVSQIAVPVIAVIYLDASAFTVAALIAVDTVAWPIFGLPIGVLVDRLPKKRTIISCQLARMIIMGSIPLTYILGSLELLQLFIVAGLGSVVTVFASTSQTTLLPALVKKESLIAANGTLSSTRSASDVGGKAAAGLLIQLLSAPIAIVADVIFNATALLATTRLPKQRVNRPSPEPLDGQRSKFISELLLGVRYTFGHGAFRAIAIVTALTNLLAVGQFAILTVFILRTLDSPPAAVGFIVSVSSLGGILGAMATHSLSRAWGTGRVWHISLFSMPFAAALIPMSPDWPWVLVAMTGLFFLAIGLTFVNILASAIRQSFCPPEMLGRLTATTSVITGGAVPLGALMAGGLAELLGVRAAFWVLAGLFVLPWTVSRSSFMRGVRSLEDLVST